MMKERIKFLIMMIKTWRVLSFHFLKENQKRNLIQLFRKSKIREEGKQDLLRRIKRTRINKRLMQDQIVRHSV